MAVLIDTNIAIQWRDGNPGAMARIAALDAIPSISVITLVELQAGVVADRSTGALREALLARLLQAVPILPFTALEAAVYRTIIAAAGYDRRRVLDRMIAAQAITAGLPLITANPRDFREIERLTLEVWPAA